MTDVAFTRMCMDACIAYAACMITYAGIAEHFADAPARLVLRKGRLIRPQLHISSISRSARVAHEQTFALHHRYRSPRRHPRHRSITSQPATLRLRFRPSEDNAGIIDQPGVDPSRPLPYIPTTPSRGLIQCVADVENRLALQSWLLNPTNYLLASDLIASGA